MSDPLFWTAGIGILADWAAVIASFSCFCYTTRVVQTAASPLSALNTLTTGDDHEEASFSRDIDDGGIAARVLQDSA
jgi:hypothetical protein